MIKFSDDYRALLHEYLGGDPAALGINADLIMYKLKLCGEIGVYFGKFYKKDSTLCIEHCGETFEYNTIDALLIDWVERLVDNQHELSKYSRERTGQPSLCWEETICFIYEKVIGKYPDGVRPTQTKQGKEWNSFRLMTDGGNEKHMFLLGTYASIVDAIKVREDFLEATYNIASNRPDYVEAYNRLAQDFRSRAKEQRKRDKAAQEAK